MDKYEKIEKPREEAEIKDNEIRITTKGKMRNSISYATTLFKVRAFSPPPPICWPSSGCVAATAAAATYVALTALLLHLYVLCLCARRRRASTR
jgi:hypothetical protein